ncbi:hypothetical protein RKE29_05795 [Streptomyces sp. B1866]|uniref:hypothetical protein n=1 Tax=Streptomyces sp. B1866 TaxID=3075431 RepID=UPI00288FEF07|nr:hypothetical protein [Streptomyces sp. B1866]MDT3396157.1 hypothetical protein [Streptomyces sp. B1866]
MPPALTANTAFLLVTLGYATLCAVSPFGPCRKCRGFGQQVRTDRHGRPRPGRACRRCRGTGKRIRLGRHLYNLARRTWRDGTR